MNTFEFRTVFFVLVTFGLGANAAGASQDIPATSTVKSHSEAPKVGAAKPDQASSEAHDELPSIISEDDIPAFLRTDPCDTGDS